MANCTSFSALHLLLLGVLWVLGALLLQEIPFGSEEEVEIRAATIVAVEQLQKCLLESHGCEVMVMEVDWLLWQIGEQAKDSIAPHHRTLTIYY